jgi:hypothetical protein
VTSATHIAALTDNAEVIADLSDILVEVVANGGSVSFMHSLARDVAADFWKDSLARAGSSGASPCAQHHPPCMLTVFPEIISERR